jgi:integrase
MASFKYENGRALIQWVDGHDERRTLRLARVDRRGAELVRLHIERLNAARITGQAPPRDTAMWLADLGPKLYGRLADKGLVEPRADDRERLVVELKAFVDGYIRGRTDLKPRSIKNLEQVRKHLVAQFGPRPDLTLLTRGDLKVKLAPATVSLHVKRARQIFQDAVDRKLIAENPVKGIKAGKQSNAARMVYVPAGDIDQVISHCPDDEWRAIFALARYGGLRVPSETTELRWPDIDWDAGRMTVRSPKTEHHEGRAERIVPLFPELARHLLKLFSSVEPGETRVVVRHRGENLRTMAEKIIRRAGLTPWVKLFQNCRSSRETDLANQYPIHVVCQWIGNTEAVARRHYLQVTEQHLDDAAGKSAARSAAATGGMERKTSAPEMQKPPETGGFASDQYPQGESNPCPLAENQIS